MSNNFSILPKELPGEDFFEGKSHEHIADTILEQIRIGELKLIGIEGKWGSGKSNILNIIENKVKKSEMNNKIIFFSYNAWLHQNDVHRRIIPTELYETIKDEKYSINENKTKELLNNLKILLGTITETTINRVPRFSWGMIIVFFEIIILPVLNTIFSKAYEKSEINICQYILRMVISIFVLPLILYIFMVIKNKNKKNIKTREAFKKSLMELFAIYQISETKEIEDTSVTYTREKNPSLSDFKNFMLTLSSIISYKKMIIVFDDIDRMQKENIQDFWGTLHNLFVYSDYGNIFVLVPFEREQINNVFSDNNNLENGRRGDEYINKTFDVIYRVSLPILSDYNSFFKIKWENALGSIVDNGQYSRVFQIFDMCSLNITPRNIIAFINEFVTTKQLFKDTIPDEYIALFIMHKDSILENPTKKIIDLDFLGKLESFYKDNEETSKYLAALAFQIEPERALDVVYKHSLKRALNNGSSVDIENISNSKIFFTLLIPLLPELENIDNAIIFLDHVSEKMEADPILKTQVWNDIFKLTMKKLFSLPIDSNKVLPYQFALIRNLSENHIRNYLSELFQFLSKNKNFLSIGYFNIEKIFRDELKKKSIYIDSIMTSLPKKYVSAEEYIKLVEYAKERYKEVNLFCPVNEIDALLMTKNITELNTLSYTKYLYEKSELKGYKKRLNDFFIQYSSDYLNLQIIIERLKDIEETIDVSKLHPTVIQNMYNNSINQKSDFIYDIIAMRLSVPQFKNINFNNNIIINYLNSNEQENELVKNTSNVIQNYNDFGNLLINLESMNIYPLYVNIIHYILKNKSGKKLYIISVLQNFEMICTNAKVEPQLLINNLSAWLPKLKENDKKYKFNETFSLFFIKEILKSNTEFAIYCIEQLKKYLDNYTKDEWKQSITQNDSYELLVTKTLDYKYNTFAVEAMHEILLEFAKSDVSSVERIHYEKIISHMVSKEVNFTKTFNSVRDLLCQKGELNCKEFLFWSEWLFIYSKLETKQEVLRTIFPVSLLDDNDCLNVLVKYKNILPNIISSAGDESAGFIDGLKARLEKNPDSNLLIEIADVLNIKIPKNKTNEKGSV
jgi:hypothetical protein